MLSAGEEYKCIGYVESVLSALVRDKLVPEHDAYHQLREIWQLATQMDHLVDTDVDVPDRYQARLMDVIKGLGVDESVLLGFRVSSGELYRFQSKHAESADDRTGKAFDIYLSEYIEFLQNRYGLWSKIRISIHKGLIEECRLSTAELESIYCWYLTSMQLMDDLEDWEIDLQDQVETPFTLVLGQLLPDKRAIVIPHLSEIMSVKLLLQYRECTSRVGQELLDIIDMENCALLDKLLGYVRNRAKKRGVSLKERS